MNTIITLLVALALTGSLILVSVYWSGAIWWRNRIGRAVMFQAVEMLLILSYVMARRLSAPIPPLVGGQIYISVSVWFVVAVGQLGLGVSFALELRDWRRRRRAAQ